MVPAVRALVRNELHRRAAALSALGIVLALGAGTGFASLTIARRTEQAYPQYLRDADVGDVIINPSLDTDHIREVLASTPGVIAAASDTMYVVTPDDGHPRPITEGGADFTQTFVSKDGRYRDQDRPVVHRGRLVGAKGEAFLSVTSAESLGLDVGDELPLAFWQATLLGEQFDPNELISPVGRTRARIVGVGVFADEVLPDGLYPRKRIVLSPDLVEPYDCPKPHPPADDSVTMADFAGLLIAEGCSRDPGFVSLRVAGGEKGVPAVLATLAERLAAENARLPKEFRENQIGFVLIPTVTADERIRIQRSLAPTVRALQLFGLAAVLATLNVVGLIAARSLRRIRRDTTVWFELGMTRLERMTSAGLPLCVAGGIGLVGAIGVAWLASGIGPVASAAALEPHPARSLDVGLTALVVGVMGLGLIAVFAAVTRLATRERIPPPPDRPSRVSGLALRAGHLPLALGVRAALPTGAGAQVGAGALLGGAVAVMTAVVACLVFSFNLSGLVGSPVRFGWAFDAAAIVNYGFAGADEARVARGLDRDDVEKWGLAALPHEVRIKGEPIPALAAMEGFDRFPLPVVEGRYPTSANEIGLGVRSARELKLGVGDHLRLSSAFGERDARVAGLVVLPAIGTFASERVGLGVGAFLPAPFLDALVVEAERAQSMPPDSLKSTLGTFIAIDLRDGADTVQFAKEIQPQVMDWDVNAQPGLTYGTAVRPPEIADIAAIRYVPNLLAALLSLTMSVALALAIALGTRSRRRELAVLRALGFTGTQLRSTVRWHAVVVVAVGAAFGVLLGMSLGSLTWRAFSEDLGSARTLFWPAASISLVVVAAAAVAVVAGALSSSAGSLDPSTRLLEDDLH